MGRIRKKLKINDINKNSSIEVSHTIKKIKEHEVRYTVILVSFFMLLFVFIGYETLKINDDYFDNNIEQKDIVGYDSSFSGEVILLNKKSIMSDLEGLKSKGYTFKVENTTNNAFRYRIILVPFIEQIEMCGCKGRVVDSKNIKYSIDGKTIQSTVNKNIVLLEDNINKLSVKEINIKIWLDDSLDDKDYHYHGYLKMEKY